MTKPFFERLNNYYLNVGEVLQGNANTASIFPNKTDVGMSREQIYAEVLHSHLPSNCSVQMGGFLFDQEGNESNQIDIIITGQSSLQFNYLKKDSGGKVFACIDGCVGAVSVKSHLDSKQLIESLNNIASLPNKSIREGMLNPFLTMPNYEDWPYKVIFSFDGIAIQPILATLNSFYDQNPHIPLNKRPNLIHVAGKYVIDRVGEHGGTTREGQKIEPNVFYGMPLPDYSDVYGLLKALLEMQKIALASTQVLYNYDKLMEKVIH
jgi:hypothetical protein